ncbi:MAG: DNA polymerase IV [Planctomycetes bacterium]|nr:DNA polymerase IV [Planctomycetota bacterium]
MPPEKAETILHVDMDAFYASVEQRDSPDIRDKPVIVGGHPEGRGVVSAASYEARKFGVRSAMPISVAKRLCPRGVFLPVRMGQYVQESRKIRRILHSYTPLIEPLSLDEAFLDVAGSVRLFGSPETIGREIKDRIRAETQLTASVGIAPNKFLAKLASDLEKPNGFVVIREAEKLDFIAPLPISRIWGVGKAAEAALHEMGVRTIGDLRRVSVDALQPRFGKWAEALLNLCRGIDSRVVVPDAEAKSIGSEITFETDIGDLDALLATLLDLSEDVGERLRTEGCQGRTITIKARYPDFKTITRRMTLAEPTDGTSEIYRTACAILQQKVPLENKPLRLIGVTASGLLRGGVQLSLFDQESRAKSKRLDKTVDEIRKKMGPDAIKRGRLL